MLLIQIIREKINVRIYNSKTAVINVISFFSLIVTLYSFGNIIYYYGFPKTTESIKVLELIIKICFVYYVLNYFIRFFYSFEPLKFLRTSWFEGMILLLVFIGGLSSFLYRIEPLYSVFDLLSIDHLIPYTHIIVQVLLLIIIMIELGKAGQYISSLKLGPASLLTLSFVVLILSGAGLLMMPEMTTQHHIRFIDALFTSTSASCVTGLVVVDTAVFFTLKGKIIIMLLIQLGGINIISFATFIVTFYRKASGIKHLSLIKDLTSAGSMTESKNILRKIIFYSFIIEGVGCILLFFLWNDQIVFSGNPERFFYSLFHSISAFNNAGFSLFTNNLYELTVRHSYWIHIVIAVLIFLGGLGFIAMQDIIGLNQLRSRFKYPWKKLQVGTKIALYTSFALIVLGALFFYFLEINNTLKEQSIAGSIVTSFFQSVSARTAGYNTIDFSVVSQPTLIIFIFLMFIGASPGSTGGGIKTTTFAILFKSAIATIRGKRNIELYKRNISFDLVNKAYFIVLFSFSLIMVSSFMLSITDGNFTFLQLLFDEVSAFGTVGLSTGITPFLSDAGKYILIATMFIGRIGPLTLALSLSKKVLTTKYKYPNASLMIG